MSDIQSCHGCRPRHAPLASLRAGHRRAQARRRRSRRRRTPSSPTSRTRSRPPRRRRRASVGRSGTRARAVVRVNGADTALVRGRSGAAARELAARRARAAEGDAGGGRGARRRGPAGDRDRRDGAGPAARLRDGLRARGWPRSCSARSTSAPSSAWSRGRTGSELLYARSKLVVDSAAAGIRAPFDIVHLDTRGRRGSRQRPRFARSLGFRGKACIHPAQVAVVNRVVRARAARVAWARRVVDAYERGAREGRARSRSTAR